MSPSKKVKHIDFALLAKAHPKRHLIHKYWARKPHNVVADYIEHYSEKGEIVLDPFVGSGVTAIEALRLGRKAVAIDLNPIATFITRMIAKTIDLEKLKNAFDQIEKKVKREIETLYETTCDKCKGKAQILATIWERENLNPIELRYFCPTCKKRHSKIPSKSDVQKIREIEKTEIPYWYPKNELRYPDGIDYMKKELVGYIPNLFTKRNLLALSMIYNEIEGLEDFDMSDIMKFAFSSMVHLASKMTPIAKPSPRSHWSKFSATSFWAVHSYWVPPRFMESNVWMLFESAVIKGAQGVLKGKKDSNEQIPEYKEATTFSDLEGDANILILTQSALDLSNIPDNSIDYIFTDPPYGGDIQYFELSTLWLSWLRGEKKDERFKLEWWDEEVTINREQNKDFEYYHNRVYVAFRELFRVLKAGKFLTVTFHNTEVKIYNSILRAVIFAGFELERIIYQPPARASAKALMQPYGSAIGDYYIRFRKPIKAFTKFFEREADEKKAKRIILESVKKILIERGEPTALTDILKGHTLVYSELRKHGYRIFGANPESISKVIGENRNKEFVFIKGEGWWFKEPSKYHTEVPLNERVELTVLDTLYRKVATFDDILQDIYLNFTNAKTPSPNSVKEIVQEYATPKARKWILKPIVREREKEHSEMIGFLAELGKKSGYSVWIGLREQSDMYEKKPLSKLNDFEELSLSEISPDDVDSYIKQIDILWIKDMKVAFSFEVEYTTAITEAFMRCSAIPESHQTRRFIVIPEEREKFMYRKLRSQLLRERIEKEDWKLIFFKNLREFYNKNKRKNSINEKQILEIARTPVEERKKQASIDSF